VIQEPYRSDVGLEYVIRGNSVVLKCGIPPFIADFVSVISWQDDTGNIFPSMSTQLSTHGICKLDHMSVWREYVLFNLNSDATVKYSTPNIFQFIFIYFK